LLYPSGGACSCLGGRDCSENGPRLPGGAEQAGKRSRGEAIAAESPAPPEIGPVTGLQTPAGAAERFKKIGWNAY